MNPMLTAKKDALLKLIKERDMKDFFTIRDAGDESTTFFDARETLKNGKKVYFRMILDDSVFNTARIGFYLLTDNSKRDVLLAAINERNENSTFIKFFLTEDNMLSMEFTYAALNDHFQPAFFMDLLMMNLETLDEIIYDDFMKVLA